MLRLTSIANSSSKGASTPFTSSEAIIDENTVEAIAKWNGEVTNRGTRNISEDGKKMTMDLKAFTPDGHEIPFVLVFNRKHD